MFNLSISSYEFEQLKRFFDQNDIYNGASYLTLLLRKPFDAWKSTDPYNANNSDKQNYYSDTGLPFALGDGLSWGKNYSSNKLTIELAADEERDTTLLGEMYALRTELNSLKQAFADLQAMHTEDGNHIPTIISTKEQAEALKDKLSKEERVLVHTTFDRALRAFD